MNKPGRRRKIRLILILIAVLMCLTAISFYALIRLENSRTVRRNKAVSDAVVNVLTDGSGGIARKLDSKKVRQLPFAVHIYSHQGGSDGTAEEHSFAAYDHAIACGSVNIEQDIVISADGTPYVSHDRTAYRLTGAGRSYSEMHDGEIDSLRTYQGNPILRLEDVFSRYGKKVNYIVELKDGNAAGAFERCVKEFGYEDNVVVQSFDSNVLRNIEDVFPDMKKLLLCRTRDEMNAGLEKDYVDIIGAGSTLMTKGDCDTVHKHGREFDLWTLDSEDDIKKAIEIGADTYFTNYTERAFRIEKEYRKSK